MATMSETAPTTTIDASPRALALPRPRVDVERATLGGLAGTFLGALLGVVLAGDAGALGLFGQSVLAAWGGAVAGVVAGALSGGLSASRAERA